ncbi:hypothetical protein [Corynebacterium frankenforstense]|uniref:hypothetical protein n=1 Tax=Corynebacterium frankenforstense TaxID=1230998 RepID=UPI001B801D33|nr:hypothetical protein [Corynebacterium frankenforstense]
MDRTGVRGGELAGLDRAGTIAVLREKVAALSGGAGAGGGGSTADAAVVDAAHVLGLGARLDAALPLTRGAVTELDGCAALVAEALARATAAGLSVGVVGWPELSFAGVAEAGGELDRVVAVPRAGAEPAAVAGVLVDGLDLVVWRGAGELTPRAARPLLARLRGGTAALLAVGVRVPSPLARVSARVTGFDGLGRGAGRIRVLEIGVRTLVRGAAPRSTVLRLGAPGPLADAARDAGAGAEGAVDDAVGGVRRSAGRLRAV